MSKAAAASNLNAAVSSGMLFRSTEPGWMLSVSMIRVSKFAAMCFERSEEYSCAMPGTAIKTQPYTVTRIRNFLSHACEDKTIWNLSSDLQRFRVLLTHLSPKMFAE
jgi:hypothetical protein